LPVGSGSGLKNSALLDPGLAENGVIGNIENHTFIGTYLPYVRFVTENNVRNKLLFYTLGSFILFKLKGSVSRDLRWVLLYINGKLS